MMTTMMIWAGHQECIGQIDHLGDVGTDRGQYENDRFEAPTAVLRPPLWSSGQSSWLQIRRSGFDYRHYQKKVVGLERGQLSLTREERAPGTRWIGWVGPRAGLDNIK
jgi:hypothetical protein